jgi:uncharacterized protein (DUF2236 family)
VRELYGLRWSRAQELAFRATVEAMRRSRPFVPRRVRQGANADAYDLVARTERRRIERGDTHAAGRRLTNRRPRGADRRLASGE